MPSPLDEPLRRTSLNLFEKDAAELERRHGRGWTEKVRDLVRQYIRDTDLNPKIVRVEDLFDKEP